MRQPLALSRVRASSSEPSSTGDTVSHLWLPLEEDVSPKTCASLIFKTLQDAGLESKEIISVATALLGLVGDRLQAQAQKKP